VSSWNRKREDKKRFRKRAGRTPDILRKSGPHTKEKSRDNLIRTKWDQHIDLEWEYNEETD
jgi:hypothetical protein